MGTTTAAVTEGAADSMAARRRAPERSSARLSGSGGAAQSRPPPGAAPPRAPPDAAERRRRAAERAREVEDSPRVLRAKCRRLARALARAKHLVVYTGAGISTAADIPDYRGPRGVWTRLAAGGRAPRAQPARAAPTYTHMALTALWARGLLKFVVSQNCDGLHVRAGLPRRALAELHGNMFAERCAACARVYLRAFDTSTRTARHAHGTRRLCHACGAELQDTIVHFGERGAAPWPLNWAGALRHAAAADVVLCLGSSLKVLRRYPRLWRMHAPPQQRPRLYIVNLQWTPKDAVAELKINARCDAVMAQVARRLRLRVPAYSARTDPLLWHAEPLAPAEAHTASGPRLPPAPGPPLPDDSDPEDDLPLCRLQRRAAPAPPPDDLPLCRLQRRGRSPPPPAPLSLPPLVAPPDLHAFQVSLVSGAATILLRAEHAPAESGAADLADLAGPPLADLAGPPLARQASALRRVRLPRLAGAWPLSARLRRLLDEKPPQEPQLKQELKVEVKVELKEEGGEEAEWARALAAAIIARAVLVCRGQLYPGLHTIVGAGGCGGAAGCGGGCGWCGARCGWYGAPALTPPGRRAPPAPRRLCACCAPGQPPASPRRAPDDQPGWFGKGYRKGRRKRS